MTPVRCLLLLLGVATLVHAENPFVVGWNIVPQPVAVRSLTGTFTLNDQTRILAKNNESRRIVGLFNDFLLNQLGFHLKVGATALERHGQLLGLTPV
jgi:hypothetical protein